MTAWPTVKLGEAIDPVQRPEVPTPGKRYRQIGVRLWGEGAYERESIDGSETKYAQLFLAEADDVIVNKIWARNGSVAVVGETLAGSFGSGEFPMFKPRHDRVYARWLHWLTKTPSFWEQCDLHSRGTSGQNRIRPERFLEIEIPLPPLSEQRRVVVRIEGLAADIDEACALRHQAAEEAELLLSRSRAVRFAELGDRFGTRPLGELISMTSGEGLTSSQVDNGAPYPVYGGGGLTGRYSRFLFEKPKIVIGRVGARCGCVFVTEPKAWVTDNALYLTEISDELHSPYLVHALTTLDLRQQANQAAQPVVSQKKINPMQIPVPPLPEQRRIVAELNSLQAEVDTVMRLQAETAAELDALLPSILDRAFRGEL